ncbi:MAG: oligosaccharide repeat unit polymerase [Blastocatellia bacterium]|nr:MAG: oligosaccharide repeat unit polymerase [Blastocatellia bacterium]
MESASAAYYERRRLAFSAPSRAIATSVVAIAITGLGTLFAVLLIPANSGTPGALFYSALAMTLGLLITPLVFVVPNPKAALRADCLLALAPIYWLLLDLLQGVYAMDSIDPSEIAGGFIAIGVFCSAAWLGALRRPWSPPGFIIKSVSRDFTTNTYFAAAVMSFLIGMLRFAIPCNFDLVQMFSYAGQERWAAPWGRGQLGGWDAFLDHLQYFGYLLPVFTIILTRYVGWRNVRTLACVVMSGIMTLFIAQSGSRRVLGVILGMALVFWVLSQPRLRVKQVVVSVISVAALLIALQIMLEYRNVGLGVLVGQRNQTASGLNEKQAMFEEQYLRVDDNFYRLCQVIQLIPKSFPYVYHRYIIYVIVRPIPRVFWPGKPVDPGFDLPTALGVEGVSYSYSVIGELYMSFGFLGIAIGGWFYGRIAAMANGLLSRSGTVATLLVYSIVVMALFAGLRSMLDLLLVSYVVLVWVFLSRFFSATRA